MLSTIADTCIVILTLLMFITYLRKRIGEYRAFRREHPSFAEAVRSFSELLEWTERHAVIELCPSGKLEASDIHFVLNRSNTQAAKFQELCDRVLKWRWSDFVVAAARQNSMRDESKALLRRSESLSRAELEARVAAALEVDREVKQKKEAFWKLHRAIKGLGVPVFSAGEAYDALRLEV